MATFLNEHKNKMELNGTQTENFVSIEEAIKDKSINDLSIHELEKIKTLLLTDSPIQHEHHFKQRWDRVELAITSKINSKINSRRFRIQITIGVITLILVSVNLYYANFHYSSEDEQKQQQVQRTK